jgi:hypothetical protein
MLRRGMCVLLTDGCPGILSTEIEHPLKNGAVLLQVEALQLFHIVL